MEGGVVAGRELTAVKRRLELRCRLGFCWALCVLGSEEEGGGSRAPPSPPRMRGGTREGGERRKGIGGGDGGQSRARGAPPPHERGDEGGREGVGRGRARGAPHRMCAFRSATVARFFSFVSSSAFCRVSRERSKQSLGLTCPRSEAPAAGHGRRGRREEVAPDLA